MPTKIVRLIDTYKLEALGEELENRWLGEGYERESLRKLARRFNVRLLGERMAQAGLSPLDGEVKNTYRLLNDDDISVGMQLQAERELERAGIDIETLRNEFVSHQAVHTYLTSERGLEAPSNRTSPTERLKQDTETIRRLSSRVAAVTEDTVNRHSKHETLTAGTVSVIVDVTVLCEDCSVQASAIQFLQNGGCNCQNESSH